MTTQNSGIYTQLYHTAFGNVIISSDGESVTEVQIRETIPEQKIFSPCRVTDRAAVQLGEYFAGQRKVFDLPLNPKGTDFSRLVWSKLRSIPYGETRSYKQIAAEAGNAKACRAVGMANNKNPIMVIVPCHRVIGSDGSLVGYAGGTDLKKRLLELEERWRNK